LLADDYMGRTLQVCSCLSTLAFANFHSVFVFGLANGGPAGLIYGFLFVWLGYGSVVLTMGELVSMWPTAGGQYHWTHRLAPEKWKNVMVSKKEKQTGM
jgi:choline transport protein